MRAIRHRIASSFYQIVVRSVVLRGEFNVSCITFALCLSTYYIRLSVVVVTREINSTFLMLYVDVM